MTNLILKIIAACLIGLGIGYYAATQLSGTESNSLIYSHILVAVLAVVVAQLLPTHLSASTPTAKTKKTAKNGRLQGEVKWFNGGKGFGFITYGDEQEIFVHFRSLRKDSKRLSPGKKVEFSVGAGKKGDEAEDVVVLD